MVRSSRRAKVPRSSDLNFGDINNDGNNGDDYTTHSGYDIMLSDQADGDDDYVSQHRTKRFKIDVRDNPTYSGKEDDLQSDEEIEANLLGFCCQNCHCSEDLKQLFVGDEYVTSSKSNSLWHRRCCHNVIDCKRNWLAPIEKARKKAEEQLLSPKENMDHPTIFEFPKNELRKIYNTAKSNESTSYNAEGLETVATRLWTCPQYRENVRRFDEEVKIMKTSKPSPLQKAVVLDMFGGIGSAIVALKRLSIGIQKIIHVDHDKIATHVHRWNHDPSYNNKLPPDDIEHVYTYNRFQQIYENLDDFLNQHGQIDIIIGGPPCIDYSGVNAYRQGTEGVHGKLMKKFGKLVRRIQETQDHKIYFLAENTLIRNDKRKPVSEGDLTIIEKSFGLKYSIEFDANYVSPCRRNRTYLTNIPFLFKENDNISFRSTLAMCLEDGYQHALNFVEEDGFVKANCFMASKGRITDARMLVHKNAPGCNKKYLCRLITTKEREIMMGFPPKYVEAPVDHLFTSILQDGFGNGLTTDTKWKEGLDVRYHHFCGNYHNIETSRAPFKFSTRLLVPFDIEIDLKLAIPQTTKTPSFFDKEGYAQHLIGNAFSIPVVEEFLRPLKDLFVSQQYEGYDYDFVWIPKVREKCQEQDQSDL